LEKKLQKLAKIMDYLERAKRLNAAPLIEAAYQRRLVEEREFYEREQQREVELSKERHESDLKEKNRLSRMLEHKEIFQAEVISRRQAEFDRIRAEKEERISQIIRARKQERDIKRKQIYYLTCEEERIAKLQAEEEARKREEAERRKKADAEHKAKLDAIEEKKRQREREMEEKMQREKDALFKGTDASSSRPAEPPAAAPVAAAAAAAAGSGKYVPRWKRQTAEASGPAAPTPTPTSPAAETDSWSSSRRQPPAGDRWGAGPRGSDRSTGSDTWGNEERRPTFGSSRPRPPQR
jgi:translation initiation factor 3 subunit A